MKERNNNNKMLIILIYLCVNIITIYFAKNK